MYDFSILDFIFFILNAVFLVALVMLVVRKVGRAIAEFI